MEGLHNRQTPLSTPQQNSCPAVFFNRFAEALAPKSRENIRSPAGVGGGSAAASPAGSVKSETHPERKTEERRTSIFPRRRLNGCRPSATMIVSIVAASAFGALTSQFGFPGLSSQPSVPFHVSADFVIALQLFRVAAVAYLFGCQSRYDDATLRDPSR